MLNPKEARSKLRKLIQQEFARVKKDQKGALARAAAEIGVSRQQLQHWAKGVPVPADVLLMAFMKWGRSVRLEDRSAKSGDPAWWEFAMNGRDGGIQGPRPRPVQMSLFEALSELQDDNLDIKILKKGIGRLALSLEIGFKKVKF